jgi:hypothetical protein
MLIQKPVNTLDVDISTEKYNYAPGGEVSFAVTVRDRLTQRLVTDRDVFISVTVTDESVYTKIENRKVPPSLGASVYLENEIRKNSNEFYYANQYVDHWF